MTYYETKIGKIIEEEFDLRMGNAVISYIIDEGMGNVKEITDEQISNLEGNGLMTQDFVQSLVRCARRICIECELAELIEFIRLHLWCTPTVQDVYLHREDFTYGTFEEVLNNLDLDESEVGDEIKLFVVVDKDYLKE